MLAATFLAVFLVPLFFKLVNDWHFRSKPEDFAHLNDRHRDLHGMPDEPEQGAMGNAAKGGSDV